MARRTQPPRSLARDRGRVEPKAAHADEGRPVFARATAAYKIGPPPPVNPWTMLGEYLYYAAIEGA